MEIIGTLAALGGLWDKISGRGDVSGALKTLGVSTTDIRLAASGGSMVKLAKNHILSPTIIVTKESYARKDIDKILESSVDVYASWIVLIFKLLVTVEKLDYSRALSVLANKGFDHEAFEGLEIGVGSLDGVNRLVNLDIESIGVKSASHKDDSSPLKTISRIIEISINSVTSDVERTTVVTNVGNRITEDDKDGNPVVKTDRKETRNNTVTTKEVPSTITIPIIIKANIHVVDFEEIVSSASVRDSSKTFFSRVLQKRLDLITTKQLWFGSDIVQNYKKQQLAKKDFTSDLNKKAGAVFSLRTLLDNKVGLNRQVVTYVMTDDELRRLEDAVGFDMNKRSEKDNLMEALMAFNITSINTDRDMVSVYIHAISGYSAATIRSLSKSGGSDSIETLAKAMMANSPFK